MSADIVQLSGAGNVQSQVPAQAQNGAEVAPPQSIQRADRARAAVEKAFTSVEEHQQGKVQEREERSIDDVKKATDQLNKVMSTFNKGLRFQVHEETSRTYVEVINKDTDEVLKEWPSKELLDTMARLHEVLGLIMDKDV
ncbi:MAG: flagellar protein FlaG [Planctomycetes bacterium]|nr:flagellar protein FlaG [Planctomycetota bacterium]